MAKLSKIVVIGAALAAAPACKGKKSDTTPKNTASETEGVPKVDLTLCETSGKNVVTYDLNKDNRPDVWRLYKTEGEGGTKVEILTCKQVDFDHDNRKDWVVAYNRKGSPIFEKADFDYDGPIASQSSDRTIRRACRSGGLLRHTQSTQYRSAAPARSSTSR